MQPVRIALVVALTGGLASAQAPAAPKATADKAPTLSQVLVRDLVGLEREFVPAAEALPGAAFNFAPGHGDLKDGEFKGVKTVAQQVRHVASANDMFGAAILGEKAPADLGGENGPEVLMTKAEIVKYLKDSFAYAHKAFAGLTETNATGFVPVPWGGKGTITRLSLATHTVNHAYDHYGQMVVYLRMNGIIPPASRQ